MFGMPPKKGLLFSDDEENSPFKPQGPAAPWGGMPPPATQPAMPPSGGDSPWYKDKNKMGMMLAALSNGFGGMTLRGQGGMKQINNAVFAQGMKNKQNNKTIEMLEKTNPKLAALAKQYPQYVGEIAKLGIAENFKEPKDQWKMIPTSENARFGLPADKPYRVNLSNGKVEAIGGGTTVNNNMRERLPTPASGYQNVLDENDNLIRQEIIPGGPADTEQETLANKNSNRNEQKANAAETVITDIERSIEYVTKGRASNVFGDWYEGIPFLEPVMDVAEGATAVGLSKVPGGRTDAAKALQLSESARSNIGIDSLQTMRENSPTGGALGQVPFQQQKRLEQLYGQLNPVEMDPDEYEYNANRVINTYSDIRYGTRSERADLVARGLLTEEQNAKIEERYKPLSRDASGRPFNLSTPPPDFDAPANVWNNASDEQKLRAWNLYESEQVPDWWSL